ncbi:MAG: hypothetical protein AB9873_09410 [Syntrophobacteraceae bacterium]
MKSRKALELLYGPAGADVAQAVPEAAIAADCGRVVHVHLRSSRNATDEVLRRVGSLPDLEELVASDTPISDAGLAHLAALPKLRSLHLSGTRSSDAGIAHLLGLPLVTLDLSRTSISDLSLERVARINSLRELWINGCSLTEEAIRLFRERRPDCSVFR